MSQLGTPITVLALNPAVDMTYEVEKLIPDYKVHASKTRFDPGGNGINVARCLKRLNISAHCFSVLGGEIGQFLASLLSHHIDTLTIERVAGETRINGTIIENSPNAQYEVSGIGPHIPETSLQHLIDAFAASTGQGFGVITGSIQPDLPRNLYAQLVERLQQQGAHAIVDAQGELLRVAARANPYLIKPNQYELEELVGRSIDGVRDAAVAARKLQQQGIEHICVSLGSEGAVWVDAENSIHAIPPPIKVNSTVGAGDSMVAGIVAGLAADTETNQATAHIKSNTIAEILRLGVACSAGTVAQPGTELFANRELAGLKANVRIEVLDI